MQGAYGEAEVGLNEAYEEFKPFRNDAQMGYSVYHLAMMNRKRGSLRQALELYNCSGDMFEHMRNRSELGNEFMVALSLECQGELYTRLCQPDEAKLAYIRARALLANIGGREITTTHCSLDIQIIPDMCESKFAIWRDVTLQFFIILFLASMAICSLCIRRRWRRGL